METPSKPPIARRPSRVPGGFDDDDDLSPIKSTFDTHDIGVTDPSSKDQAELLRPGRNPDGGFTAPLEDETLLEAANETFLQEKEMRRRLDDLDSTFLLNNLALKKCCERPSTNTNNHNISIKHSPILQLHCCYLININYAFT